MCHTPRGTLRTIRANDWLVEHATEENVQVGFGTENDAAAMLVVWKVTGGYATHARAGLTNVILS